MGTSEGSVGTGEETPTRLSNVDIVGQHLLSLFSACALQPHFVAAVLMNLITPLSYGYGQYGYHSAIISITPLYGNCHQWL